MTDNITMFGIVSFLGLMMLYKAKFMPEGNEGFFDKNNTKAMRGFWCLIVILVHIPMAYQNRIQDMIGSFGYIGVTFYFMTSAYGLSLKMKRNPEEIQNAFWRFRLTKLVMANLVTNFLAAAGYRFVGKTDIGMAFLLTIIDWVRILLLCYLVFWICCCLWPADGKWSVAVCVVIGLISAGNFFLGSANIVQFAWPVEMMGFAWGVMLADHYRDFKDLALHNWDRKLMLAGLASLILGVAYLKFKYVFFWGNYLLRIILGAAILGLVLVGNAKIAIGNKVSLFLGEISFEIYLLHEDAFVILQTSKPEISSGAFILSAMILTITLSMLAHTVGGALIRQLYKLPYFRPAKQ